MKKYTLLFLAKPFLSAALLVFLTLLLGDGAKAQEVSHANLDVEAKFSEASVDFSRQQNDDALKILEEILAVQPRHFQSLELKALILKEKGDDRNAVLTYAQLIRQKQYKDRGPYFFEAGVILNRMHLYKKAVEYLDAAVKLDFNTSAAHLFLGIIRFNNGDPKKAEQDFLEVEKTGLPEMKTAAHYYLGLIYLKEGYTSLGATRLSETKSDALSSPENKTARETAEAADKVLDSFHHGQFFASIGLLAQYDSNISEVPSGSSLESQASYRSTSEASFTAGIGYMSPSAEKFQYVPSYQFSYNDNLNGNTKEYEYASNAFSLYLNYEPLEPFTAGMKLQGIFTFQNLPNDPDDLSGSYTLSKYSLTGLFGPYFKYQINPKMRIEGEIDWSPQKYYTTPDESGDEFTIKSTLRTETSNAYLNPGGGLEFDNESTDSESLKYRAVTLSAFNVFRPTISDTVTLNLDYTYYSYYASAPDLRKDTTIYPHASVLHTVNNHWSIVGDIGYTWNLSSVPDTYQYSRFVIGAGATYAL